MNILERYQVQDQFVGMTDGSGLRRNTLQVDAPDSDLREQTSHSERAADAHQSEHRAYLQVLSQRRVQPEDREDQDLRGDGEAATHRHVGDGFDERHTTRLATIRGH